MTETQTSGIEETQRLLRGEQMEEKYAGTMKKGLPEREPEQIIFTLHSARNLADKDFVGKSDPYAILTYGTQEKQTRTIKNNLNPVWDHRVTFDHEENVVDSHDISLCFL